jgi:triosephosphate isomerase
MRNKIIAANWKMNSSIIHASNFLSAFAPHSSSKVIFFPPSPLFFLFRNSVYLFGAQDCSQFENGAYTGEVSAEIIADSGAKYVLIGHSERRLYFKEDNNCLSNKLLRANHAGLIPIFCFGESWDDRVSGRYLDILVGQLDPLINFLKVKDFPDVILAYEPVWAIGTGHTATPEQAQEVHAFIRNSLVKLNSEFAKKVHILYGGSVKANNADSFFHHVDIDGVLVGGASLDPVELGKIIGK